MTHNTLKANSKKNIKAFNLISKSIIKHKWSIYSRLSKILCIDVTMLQFNFFLHFGHSFMFQKLKKRVWEAKLFQIDQPIM